MEESGDSSAECPTWDTTSRSCHSRYRRELQHLPVLGSPVTLHFASRPLAVWHWPAKEVMSKLQALLRVAMKARGWKADFSIGLGSFLDPPSSIDCIIRTADELMYSVKLTTGKGAPAAAVMG